PSNHLRKVHEYIDTYPDSADEDSDSDSECEGFDYGEVSADDDYNPTNEHCIHCFHHRRQKERQLRLWQLQMDDSNRDIDEQIDRLADDLLLSDPKDPFYYPTTKLSS